MANNKNEDNKVVVGASEIMEYIEDIFPHHSIKDRAKMIYLLGSFELDDAKNIFSYCKKCDSFEHIEAIADLYRYLQNEKIIGAFGTLVADVCFNAFGINVLREFIRSLKDGLTVSQIRDIIDAFCNDENLIVVALKAYQRIMNTHQDNDLYKLILMCKSRDAMAASLELFQRGSCYEEIAAILIRYRNNGDSQTKVLKQEILKRRFAGTIRDNFKYFI